MIVGEFRALFLCAGIMIVNSSLLECERGGWKEMKRRTRGTVQADILHNRRLPIQKYRKILWKSIFIDVHSL